MNPVTDLFDGELSATGGEPTDNYGASTFGFNIGGGGIFDPGDSSFRGDMDEVAEDIREFYAQRGLTPRVYHLSRDDGRSLRAALCRAGFRVEVEDKGIGIPSKELDRIFDRFYQVNGTTTRHFAGTGLGLAIVHNIIEAHGGEIKVDSLLEQGTIITLFLRYT